MQLQRTKCHPTCELERVKCATQTEYLWPSEPHGQGKRVDIEKERRDQRSNAPPISQQVLFPSTQSVAMAAVSEVPATSDDNCDLRTTERGFIQINHVIIPEITPLNFTY